MFILNSIAGFVAGLIVASLSFFILSKSMKSVFNNKLVVFFVLSFLKYIVLAVLIAFCFWLKVNMITFILGILVALIYFVIYIKRKNY